MTTTEPIGSSQLTSRVSRAWTALAADSPAEPVAFEHGTLEGLPEPAQRLLRRALPDGVELSATVELAMHGEIKLGGRWLRFTADQILRAGEGFVWSPVVGGRLLRFTGADLLTPDDARMEFRVHGRIPVFRAQGADVRRSAQGRLAAETVAWLPQALTPQLGARWTPGDDERATVTIVAGGASIDVDVAVDERGQIRWLELRRRKDSIEPPSLAPFGGTVDSFYTLANGVQIAGSGTVGWDFHTAHEADGVFFRYRITSGILHPHDGSERR